MPTDLLDSPSLTEADLVPDFSGGVPARQLGPADLQLVDQPQAWRAPITEKDFEPAPLLKPERELPTADELQYKPKDIQALSPEKFQSWKRKMANIGMPVGLGVPTREKVMDGEPEFEEDRTIRKTNEQTPEELALAKQGAPYRLGKFVEAAREAPSDKVDYWMTRVPWSPAGILKPLAVKTSAERIANGVGEQKDFEQMADFIVGAERAQKQGIIGKAVDIATALPAFGMEFASTGGIASAGRIAAKKAGFIALEKAASRQIVEGGMKGLGRYALKKAAQAPAFAVGIGAQTLANPKMIAQNFVENEQGQITFREGDDGRIETIIAEDDKGFVTNLRNAFVKAGFDIGTEYGGELLEPMAKALKAKVLGSWLKRVPGRTVEAYQKVLKATGYHGVLGEMGEERLNELAAPLYGEKIQMMGGDPLTQGPAEALAFAVPGAVGHALRLGRAAIEKGKQNAIENRKELARTQRRAAYERLQQLRNDRFGAPEEQPPRDEGGERGGVPPGTEAPRPPAGSGPVALRRNPTALVEHLGEILDRIGNPATQKDVTQEERQIAWDNWLSKFDINKPHGLAEAVAQFHADHPNAGNLEERAIRIARDLAENRETTQHERRIAWENLLKNHPKTEGETPDTWIRRVLQTVRPDQPLPKQQSPAVRILIRRGVAQEVAQFVANRAGEKRANETGEDYRDRVNQLHDQLGFLSETEKNPTPPEASIAAYVVAGTLTAEEAANVRAKGVAFKAQVHEFNRKLMAQKKATEDAAGQLGTTVPEATAAPVAPIPPPPVPATQRGGKLPAYEPPPELPLAQETLFDVPKADKPLEAQRKQILRLLGEIQRRRDYAEAPGSFAEVVGVPPSEAVEKKLLDRLKVIEQELFIKNRRPPPPPPEPPGGPPPGGRPPTTPPPAPPGKAPRKADDLSDLTDDELDDLLGLKPEAPEPPPAPEQPEPSETAGGRTEISREQALAIVGGVERLLPKIDDEIPQPQDTTGQYFIGRTFAGNYFTAFYPKGKTKPPTPTAPSPGRLPPGKRLVATDNSVRDLPQQARIEGDKITIVSKVGMRKAGEYSFPLADWYAADKGPSANPNFNRVKLIERFTKHLDDQPGGADQAVRIRDSQIRAIKAALAKLKEVPTTPGTQPAHVEKTAEEELKDRIMGPPLDAPQEVVLERLKNRLLEARHDAEQMTGGMHASGVWFDLGINYPSMGQSYISGRGITINVDTADLKRGDLSRAEILIGGKKTQIEDIIGKLPKSETGEEPSDEPFLTRHEVDIMSAQLKYAESLGVPVGGVRQWFEDVTSGKTKDQPGFKDTLDALNLAIANHTKKMPTVKDRDEGIPIPEVTISPLSKAESDALGGWKWKAIASSNEGGRLAVDGKGFTEDEARGKAIEAFKTVWRKRLAKKPRTDVGPALDKRERYVDLVIKHNKKHYPNIPDKFWDGPFRTVLMRNVDKFPESVIDFALNLADSGASFGLRTDTPETSAIEDVAAIYNALISLNPTEDSAFNGITEEVQFDLDMGELKVRPLREELKNADFDGTNSSDNDGNYLRIDLADLRSNSTVAEIYLFAKEIYDAAFDIDNPNERPIDAAEVPIRDLISALETTAQKSMKMRQMAAEQGIGIKALQEKVEAVLVKMANEIARNTDLAPREQFDRLVGLYALQPLFSARTSTSQENQAYSTPAPLAFILKHISGVTGRVPVYDATAGNGMLFIGSDLEHSIGNEIDPARVAALRKLGIGTVTTNDARNFVPGEKVPVIHLNPPFGSTPNVNYGGYSIRRLELLISLKALEALQDDGKAVIILGAKLHETEKQGRGAQWIFENYLYGHFNVIDNFEVEGDLYAKQGTTWPVRVIVISGRKATPETGEFAPKKVDRLNTWNALWERAEKARDEIARRRTSLGDKTEPGGLPPGSEEDNGPAEDQGGVPPLPGGPPKPPRGGGRGGRKGGGKPTAPIRPPGRREPVAPPEGVPRPEDTTRVDVQPGSPGVPPGTLETELGGGAEDALPAVPASPEGGGPNQPANVPGQPPLKSAAEMIAEAARQGITGMDEAVKAIHQLLGGGRFVGTGPAFDERSYAKFLPHFKASLAAIKKAGKSLGDFIQYWVAQAGDRIKLFLRRFVQDERDHKHDVDPLSIQYEPRAEGTDFDLLTPAGIGPGTHAALDRIVAEVGPLVEYVADRLNMSAEHIRSEDTLSSEQIDAVAMAIYNIEKGNPISRALIEGDDTGIGKGRVAAALIHYAKIQGKIPIFFTKEANLFSNMWGDLSDIGARMKPLILGNVVLARITDANGTVIVRAPNLEEQNDIFARIMRSGMASAGYDSIFATYSQIRGEENNRQKFLNWLTSNNDSIVILDEAHEAAGDSSTSMQSAFMQGGAVVRGTGAHRREIHVRGILNNAGVLPGRGGVMYLSATFAKRADNMGLYFRTSLSQAADNVGQLVAALKRGGVALQQAFSEALAKEGEYIRRERSFAGTVYKVHTLKVADPAALLRDVDATTDLLGQIVEFSHLVVGAVKAGASPGATGTALSQNAIDMTEFAAVVHNQISQLLLSAKVDSVVAEVEAAVARGEKPVLALMNTMETLLSNFTEDNGIRPGANITLRWNELLSYALSRTLRGKTTDPGGNSVPVIFDPMELGLKDQYDAIVAAIGQLDIPYPVSPIDYIIQKLAKRGINVGELTGRMSGITYTDFEKGIGIYRRFKKINKNTVIAQFNNGDLHGMLLNASGSTGISAHAGARFMGQVSRDKSPRHMFIVQAAHDISVFVQTLGRIRRTGMVSNGVNPDGSKWGARYTHLVLPLQAEIRPAAMTNSKMKSLQANTTSESEGNVKIEAPNILNEYGDEIVTEYLDQNPEFQSVLGLFVDHRPDGTVVVVEDTARKFTGRMAILPDAVQAGAYGVIVPAYNEYIEQLKTMGEYDLDIVVHTDWDGVIRSDAQLLAGSDESRLFTASIRAQSWEITDNRHVPTGEEMRAEFERKSVSRDALREKLNAYDRHVSESLQREMAEARQQLAEAQADPDLLMRPQRVAAANAKIAGITASTTRWAETLRFLRGVVDRSGRAVTLTDAGTHQTADGMMIEIKFPSTARGVRVAKSAFHLRYWVDAPGGKMFLRGSVFTPTRWSEVASSTPLTEMIGVRTGQRYNRWVVTGNPVRAYETTAGAGKLIRFKSRAGETITGLLMPMHWDISNLAADPRLTLVSGRAVEHFLRNQTGQTVPVENLSGIVRIDRGRHGNYTITVPWANRTGGPFHQDRALRNITGDFIHTGSRGVATVLGPDLAKAVDRVMVIAGERLRAAGDTNDRLVAAVEASNRASGAPPTGGATSQFTWEGFEGGSDQEMVPKEQVQKTIDDFKKRYPNTGAITTVATAEDLPAFIAEAVPANMKVPAGVITTLPDGSRQIYVVLDQVTSVNRLLDILAHEAIGHGALEDVMGAQFREIALLVERRLRDGPAWKRVAEVYTSNSKELMEDERFTIGKELLARMAEGKIKSLSLWEKIVATVKAWWRKHFGQGSSVSDAEIRSAIIAARNYAAQKPTETAKVSAPSQFSASFSAAESSEGGNVTKKVATETGVPTTEEAPPVADDQWVETQVKGKVWMVRGRDHLTAESAANSLDVAHEAFAEAGLPGREVTMYDWGDKQTKSFVFLPKLGTAAEAEAAGKKLAGILQREIRTARFEGKAADHVAALIVSVNENFAMPESALGQMTKQTRNDLFAMAQEEASWRGRALRALANFKADIGRVGMSVDVYLQRIYAEAFSVPPTPGEPTFGDDVRKALKDAGLTDAEIENIKKLLADPVTAERIKAALRLALAKVGKAGRRVFGPRNWRTIQALIQSGILDDTEWFQRIARKNGWRVPTDAEVARMRELAEHEQRLRQPTDEELAQAGDDPLKLERLFANVEAATINVRDKLFKKIAVMWSQFTKPVSMRNFWTFRSNNARFLNELITANILFRASFAVKQGIDITTQWFWRMPMRAVGQALELRRNDIENGEPTQFWEDTNSLLKNIYRDSVKAFKPAISKARAVMTGELEVRNVDRLMNGIAAIDRIWLRADNAAAAGRTAEAVMWRLAGMVGYSYRVAGAFDMIHGTPGEWNEIRFLVTRELRDKADASPKVAAEQAEWAVMGVLAEFPEAVAMARSMMEARGIERTERQLKDDAWHIIERRRYERIRTLSLPVDEIQAEAEHYRQTLGWNKPELRGAGGLVGAGVRGLGQLAEGVGLSLAMGRFANAIAIGINRNLHKTFLYKMADIPLPFVRGGNLPSPWHRTVRDTYERRLEAAAGTAAGGIVMSMVIMGVIKVWLRPPPDPEERALWEKEGHKAGTLEIPIGNGNFQVWGLTTGPFALVAPYLAGGAAINDLALKREKAQKKLDAEAAKLGVPAGKLPAPTMGDLMSIAAQAAYGAALGTRTASGSLNTMLDYYGSLNVKKFVASQLSPMVPGLPALQEISRMSGVVMDPKKADVADFMFPLPTSSGRKSNMLGDPVGTESDGQRVLQVLTGGFYPSINPEENRGGVAYQALFASGYRPPSINPNQGHLIDGEFRPFTERELERYTDARGRALKAELEQIGPTEDPKEAQKAYLRANEAALREVGVSPTPAQERAASGPQARGVGPVGMSQPSGAVIGTQVRTSGSGTGQDGASSVRRRSLVRSRRSVGLGRSRLRLGRGIRSRRQPSLRSIRRYSSGLRHNTPKRGFGVGRG